MPDSPYKVAHVMPWAEVGGTEHATLRIARATGGAQFHHAMFCLDDAPAVASFFADAGFETFTYSRIEPSYRHAARYLSASFSLARSFKRSGIDLVHCADVAAAFNAGLAGRLAGARVLCHVRNRHEELTRRDQSFLRFIHKFALVSAETRRRFAYRNGARRGVVIYDGIDVSEAGNRAASARDVRQEFGLSEEIKLIGMLARVAPQKDFLTLAKAAAMVVSTRRDLRFLIVGNHECENRAHYEEVRRALETHGVAEHFIFTGFRTDVARLLDALDIFVLSTHIEGLPLVVLEAMAHGLPIVATAVDGIPELVRDGETGLLHAHEDAEQLAAKLLALLADERFAARLGAKARECVKANWSGERFASDMKDLYLRILGAANAAEGTGGIAEAVAKLEGASATIDGSIRV